MTRDSWNSSNDLRDPGCAHVITRVSLARDDIFLYNILAARDNLKIVTRVLTTFRLLLMFEPGTVPAPIT